MVAILLVALLIVAACAPKPAASPTPTKPAASPTLSPITTPSLPPTPATPAINASTLFASKCAACHGANRQGTPGLAPALNAQSLAGKSDTLLSDTINNGKTGTAMPAFKGQLTSAEIDALIKFIKSP
ncbi:MAG: c-type cytochrome [Chloroflexi bacterium]|nr:c-type cytochrome [Chloroflexota bacterium]